MVSRNLRHEPAIAEHPRILATAAVEVDVVLGRDAVKHKPPIRVTSLIWALSQHAQRDGCRQPRNAARAEIRTVAAPLALIWSADAPSPHGQQMQIADQFQQVRVRVNEHGLIALLKQVPRFALPPVDAPGVLAAEPLHQPAYRHVRDLHDQSDRVDLPAEGVHAHAASDEHRGQETLESRVIRRLGKNGLTCVAALDDVVDALRHVKSGSA